MIQALNRILGLVPRLGRRPCRQKPMLHGLRLSDRQIDDLNMPPELASKLKLKHDLDLARWRHLV